MKKYVFRADLKVVIVAAILMCGGSEFQTGGNDPLSFVFYRVEALGGGRQHWNELKPGRRIEMQDIREISRVEEVMKLKQRHTHTCTHAQR